MDKIKIIKTEQDYNEALELIKVLMDGSPDPNSEEGEKLSLLAKLVEDYESNLFPETLPDPIDAILFRMEQANLKPADLVPFIGSRSKVSEVLGRKRPLTVSMMRALSEGLGIPAKVLLNQPDKFKDPNNISWSQFPIKEMEKRGYFEAAYSKDFGAKELIEKFFAPIGSPAEIFALTRKTDYIRTTRPMDQQALVAWSGYILKRGLEITYPKSFEEGSIDSIFMQKVAKLSVEPNGPIKAIELLRSFGIGLVIEQHFPKTYLDGAVIMTNKEHPIIGLTLRHNRLDNFWFTLMHELAHIALHYDAGINLFYDDLDNIDSNKIEKDADELAGESLIPQSKWESSPAKLIPSLIAAQSLAKELGIHPAIVAGKMRHEGGRYQYLNSIVTETDVRKYFPDNKWNK